MKKHHNDEIDLNNFKMFGVAFDPICDRLRELFKTFEVPFHFSDMRLVPPSDEHLKRWAEFLGDEYPINLRSTLFKKSEKRFYQLEHRLRLEWLREHYHVIQRPIIETANGEVFMIGGRPETILKALTGIDI